MPAAKHGVGGVGVYICYHFICYHFSNLDWLERAIVPGFQNDCTPRAKSEVFSFFFQACHWLTPEKSTLQATWLLKTAK